MANPEQGPPAGVTPHLMLADANAALAFFEAAFDGDVRMKLMADDGKRIMHCHIVINGGSLMFCDAFPEHGHPAVPPAGYTLHLQVADIDTAWKRAVDAGCEVIMPVEKMFWGDRYGILKDPNGINWSMGQSD